MKHSQWITLLYGVSITYSLCVGAPDNAGTEFILGFTEMTGNTQDVVLYITTVKSSTISVRVNAPKYSPAVISETSFNVTSTETKIIRISGDIRTSGTKQESKGVHITANDEINVFGFDFEMESGDFFLAHPIDVLSSGYIVNALPQSQVFFVVLHNETAVVITLGTALAKHAVTYEGVDIHSGETIELMLHRFDTFHLTSRGDLSGTLITADKAIAMFNGKANTAQNSGDVAGHMIEQVPAIQSLGKIFIASPIPDYADDNLLKFVASADKTFVKINCTDGWERSFVLTFAGDVTTRDLITPDYCTIEADKHILLTQLCRSNTDNTKFSMIIITPIEQYAADYTFTTPSDSLYNNMLMVIVPVTEVNGLLLDGDAFSTGDIISTQIVQSHYAIRHIPVSEGAHTVRHISPIVTFGAYIYGTAPRQFYVTAAGKRFAPINTPCNVNLAVIIPGDGLDNDCDGRIDEELCVESYSRDQIDDDDGDGLSNEDCAKLAAIDGSWSDWSDYDTCSVTCTKPGIPNNGTQTRKRACTNPEPSNDGMPCRGPGSQYRFCNSTTNCPKNFNYVIGYMGTGDNASHLLVVVNLGDDVARINVTSKSGSMITDLNTTDTYDVTFDHEFTVKESALSSKAIRIESDNHIQVYGFNSKPTTSCKAGFIARNNATIGKMYYALTPNALIGQSTNPQVLIVGVHSNTFVSVQINVQNGRENGVYIEQVFYGNGDEFNISMNEFQTLQIQSESGDFTGMRIKSSKPISVFSGNKYVGSSRDSHLVDQLPPVSDWGTKFVSISPNYAMYKCKVVALQPSTIVQYTCSSGSFSPISLNAEGEHASIQFDSETCTFVSNNPVMIAMTTNRIDGNPSLVMLQPLEIVSGNLVFYIPTLVEAELVIAIETKHFGNITVDCESINENVLVADGMTSGRKSLDSGIHVVRTNGRSVLLSGYVHGWVNHFTFSYPLIVSSTLVDDTDSLLGTCDEGTFRNANRFIYGSVDHIYGTFSSKLNHFA
ncbi:uncharacterized protein LOC117330530 [Pecten maximus]|uniref:uncharacterized protein LOC117330530 n=1 Tax=Pecten maximus TaxID=6579 RepID=UPI001459089B|nr:uncharacterized protein LOC117330530 [Pecten maximus]